MAVPTRITDLSATASSNSPAGSDTVGTTWDDYLRAAFQIIRGDLATKGSDIASASTTDLGAVQGLFHDITGTTSITSLGTVAAGIWKVIKFEGALTLTHNATSLILPGAASITTADGDIAFVTSEGSGNWRCVKYQRANGRPVIGTVLDTIFRIQDDGDATKQIAFQASGITTSTTRAVTVPDRDITIGDLSGITNSLSGDVSLNNTANFFDGPSVAQGTSGTWFASGTVTLNDTAGGATFFVKLWDGTTVIASAEAVMTAANSPIPVSLSGYLASPAANIRISVRDTSSASGVIKFNLTGASKDSTVSAIRIA